MLETRGMSHAEVLNYTGFTETFLTQKIRDGEMPSPRLYGKRGGRLYDKWKIDAAYGKIMGTSSNADDEFDTQ